MTGCTGGFWFSGAGSPPPATITAVSSGAVSSGNSSTTLVLTLPGSRVVGNIMIAMLMPYGTTANSVTAPGWTAFAGNPQLDNTILWRIIDGTEASTITFTANATSTDFSGWITQFNGLDPVSPITSPDSTHTGTGTTASGTAIVTTRNNSCILAYSSGASVCQPAQY